MEPRADRGAWIFGGLILIGLFFGLPLRAEADSASLAWDPNTEPDLAGYEVHMGTSPEYYTQTMDVGNVTTYTVSGLSDGQTYYFAVTAYDIFANRSGLSSEVNATIPLATSPAPGEPTTTEASAPSGAESGATAEATPPPSHTSGDVSSSGSTVQAFLLNSQEPTTSSSDGVPETVSTPEIAPAGTSEVTAPLPPSDGADATSSSGGSADNLKNIASSAVAKIAEFLGDVVGNGDNVGTGDPTNPPTASSAGGGGGGGRGSGRRGGGSLTSPGNSTNPTNPTTSASAGGRLSFAGSSATLGPADGATSQDAAQYSRGKRERAAERLHQQGRELYAQGKVEEAIPRLLQASQLWASLPVSEEAAVAAHDLGVAYYAAEQHGQAVKAYEQALAIYQQLENRNLEARVLDHLGRAYEGLGDYGTAVQDYRASLQIWDNLGDQKEVAPILKRLAGAEAATGHYAAALENYRRALGLFRELGNHEELEELENAIAQVERLAGQTGPGTGAS